MKAETFPMLDLAGGPWAAFAAIVLATFLSEDLTCVAVGLLAAAGRVEPALGIVGCFAGIVAGDFGIYLLGRLLGRRVFAWSWFRRVLPPDRLAEMAVRLGRHGRKAALISRVLPGTRVPLLLAAGVLGRGTFRVLPWAVFAAALWVPAIILTVAALGETISPNVFFATAILVFALVWFVPKLLDQRERRALLVRFAKLRRWEFWPSWFFYMPLVPWYLALAVRYRSLTLWTAANPGIPAGGVVGESKADILAQLPKGWVVPTLFVPMSSHTDRMRIVEDAISKPGWEFPLILKPDAGQRGAGVKKAANEKDVEQYLFNSPGALIVQPYHPGPFEAGVFYYRIPGERTGHILGITDKVFPVAVGDGHSTLAELIWKHPRHRLQVGTFLARHQAQLDQVLAVGERFPLALAGNHCQGTLFRDGSHLVTPELECAIDAIARKFEGFFVGRFDLRYSNPDDFRNGQGFTVIELNGATAEASQMYDPAWSLGWAYATLFRQWALLFRIGAANRCHGHSPVGVVELLRLVRTYYRDRRVDPLSD